MENKIQLLDCTLRDGGYINDWNWGYERARMIIGALVYACVDVVEIGFLRNVDEYDPNVTVCSHIEELNRLIPMQTNGRTTFSAMAMRSNYDAKKLTPYSGDGIEMIRVTAHDYDIKEGLDFAAEVKKRGYKVSINPINIMGYSDREILGILDRANRILPYQFSVVDTFGSMRKRDFERIVGLADHNLDPSIRLALHLHENMSLSFSLAQNFADLHLNRPVAIDGSLMGIGRTPGNLPIELIADYLNENYGSDYSIDDMMDAIQDHIAPMRGTAAWGYTPAYFLSAHYNLHRNYAEHYLKKGDLTHRDINHILGQIAPGKRTAFDEAYSDQLYEDYKNRYIDDTETLEVLRKTLRNKSILIIAPGSSILSQKQKINEFIERNTPIIISVNFVPEIFKSDYVFFGNRKRYAQFRDSKVNKIITSNIPDDDTALRINYSRIASALSSRPNSFILLLKLLKELDIEEVVVAGADGYLDGKENYYNVALGDSAEGVKNNRQFAEAIREIGIKTQYLTPSAYETE